MKQSLAIAACLLALCCQSCEIKGTSANGTVFTQFEGCDYFQMIVSSDDTQITRDPPYFLQYFSVYIGGNWISKGTDIRYVKVDRTLFDCNEDQNCQKMESDSGYWKFRNGIPPLITFMSGHTFFYIHGMDDDRNTLFKIEVETNQVWFSENDRRAYRENWTVIILNLALGLIGLIVLTVTLVYKRECFFFGVLTLTIACSGWYALIETQWMKTVFMGGQSETQFQIVLYANASGAILYAWFHNIFAWQYYRASKIVPLHFKTETEARLSRSETKAAERKIKCRIVTYQFGPGLLLVPCLICGSIDALDDERRNSVKGQLALTAISVLMNSISSFVLVKSLLTIKVWVSKFRKWRWGRDGLFVIHIVLFVCLLLAELVELFFLISITLQDFSEEDYEDFYRTVEKKLRGPSLAYNLINFVASTFIMCLFIKFSRDKWAKAHDQEVQKRQSHLQVSQLLITQDSQQEDSLLNEPRLKETEEDACQRKRARSCPDIDIEIAFQFCEMVQDLAAEGQVLNRVSEALPPSPPILSTDRTHDVQNDLTPDSSLLDGSQDRVQRSSDMQLGS